MSAADDRRVPIVILLCGCLLVLITLGVRAGFGLFLAPMSDANGWGREVFALAVAVQNLVWGVAQPLAGAVADRYGSGRTIAVGGLLYAAGMALMAFSTTPGTLLVAQGFFIGVALSGTTFAVVLAALARAVPEHRRSWALGVGTAAGSLGQFLIVPIGQGFLAAYGWSTALLLLGALALGVVPLAAVLTGRPASTGQRQSLREALHEASAHRGYLLLTTGFFVCGFHVTFIATHLPAYLTDAGLPAELGAWALAVIGLFNIIGSYAAGVLGGRYSKKYLLSALYFARAVVIAAFVSLPLTSVSVMTFAAAIGILWLSTIPLTSGIVGQIFGPRYLATLFGIVFFSHQMGSFLGVWLGGRLFDTTGSYDVIWWAGVVLGVVSAALHWPIDEQPLPRVAAAS